MCHCKAPFAPSKNPLFIEISVNIKDFVPNGKKSIAILCCLVENERKNDGLFEGAKTMKELDHITINPEVCLGQPTIRGMRITVSIILKQIASGMTKEEILQAYPELVEEDIVQSLKYAAWLSSEKAKSLPLKEVVNA
jgi:uncharacterized protein (DUF433 family)